MKFFCPNSGRSVDLILELACLPKMTMDHQHDHERFTRLLLERSILVVVPNRTDARDILQETAVALWRQFDSYDPQRSFVNWAMGFARIETRRFLARAQRRAQLSEKAMAALEREMDGESGFAVEVERHRATCMQKLGAKQRALIQGYYHENRSVEWLAEQGGRTVEAVYKSIQRTRLDLQTCIQRQIRNEII